MEWTRKLHTPAVTDVSNLSLVYYSRLMANLCGLANLLSLDRNGLFSIQTVAVSCVESCSS